MASGIKNGEILINVTPVETRVAVVENGMLQEVYIERSNTRGIVGNIYKGKVVRVLPGMQAAFVDVGLERAAFIHAADVHLPIKDSEFARQKPDHISSLLNEGEEIVVQITKDPIGSKGARLTTRISIPSRYLVYMPDNDHVGISQRIEDEEERNRLRTIVSESVEDENEGGAHADGFILRTAADGVPSEDILADVRFLKRLWGYISASMSNVKAPALIFEDLPLYKRALRDLVRPNIEKIRIDSKETYQKCIGFSEKYVPEVVSQLEYYPGERPIFDLYSVEDELQKALTRRVQLKSGGYIIIDQTEAMTTVDVNTGGFVGHRNLEETIFKTNLEAATAIGRQLRLRNLGGIVILDFIDMEDQEHQRQVLRMLEKQLEKDHAKTKISGVSDLGLVELTRKRTRESLGQLLTESCSSCEGRGTLKTAETVCYEIFRDIIRESRAYGSTSYMVMASQAVVDMLLDEESASVADLEQFIGAPIQFQVDLDYSQEQFDVVLR
ncbi:ribonuclease G [Litoribacillus peritrichatus]|uniref:Ribonuclease G n=1 Tax=Litoribacillus peritrichatus TaxID=718191 RepID=A0ABP7N7D7_9GAMM